MHTPDKMEPEIPALLTDLYELTMAAAYWDNNINWILVEGEKQGEVSRSPVR